MCIIYSTTFVVQFNKYVLITHYAAGALLMTGDNIMIYKIEVTAVMQLNNLTEHITVRSQQVEKKTTVINLNNDMWYEENRTSY